MSNTKVSDMSIEINDIRTQNDFRSVSFSNYKKTEVKNQLIENMRNGKIEPACYWSSELICAGHYSELWDIILHFLGKYIHLGNPKLVIYVEKRYTVFRNIIEQGLYIDELSLRNYNNIRKLFAEVICVLTLSPRKHSIEPMKINRKEEFDISFMTERLKAPSTDYIKDIFRPKDPPEIYIAINEFAYHISKDSKSTTMAWYWIEWIIEFDAFCKMRKKQYVKENMDDEEKDPEWKEICKCEKRNDYKVENKFKMDIIWLIWDCLLEYCQEINDNYIETIMKGLLELFCIKYTTACCKKRRYLLYYAVVLLIEIMPLNVEIVHEKNKTILEMVVNKIDEIYKQIKNNECSPNTEYLFSGIGEERREYEQSIKKMEMLNEFLQK